MLITKSGTGGMFSIDTSAILDGWRRYYPPATFPGVWTKIDDLITAGQLRASVAVLKELEKRDDELLAWAKNRPTLFVEIDEDVQMHLKKVMTNHGRLVEQAKGRSGADPFVIALAMKYQCSVVTGEKPTGKIEKPKIPDVCNALGLQWMSLLEMMQKLEWKF